MRLSLWSKCMILNSFGSSVAALVRCYNPWLVCYKPPRAPVSVKGVYSPGLSTTTINTLRPRQNGGHFPNNIFQWISLNENVWISIKISMKLVPWGSIDNILALVQILAWCQSGYKPLSEPMMHICVTRPQWVNSEVPEKNQSFVNNIFFIHSFNVMLKPFLQKIYPQVFFLGYNLNEREREIKFIGLFESRGHRGPYSSYKPFNHNLYIGIIIFPHIDNPRSTGYN